MTTSVLRSFRPMFERLHELATGKKVTSLAELRPLRAELRQQLSALKDELADRVSQREGYLMLFAVVVHLDEIMRTSFPEADRAIWPLLQQELFDTDRGGELFYQAIGEVMDSPQLAPAVAQVFYFCLSLGFRGKFAQEPERRAEIMEKLRERLVGSAPSEPPPLDLAAERPPVRVPPLRSRAWPYAIAAAVIVVAHVALSSLAASTVASWRDREGLVSPGRPVEMAQPGRCNGGEPCRSS